MQIVAILGSPRRGGNSEILLQRFLRFAPEKLQLKLIIPSELDIRFCRGCRFCESFGHCVLKDGMQEVVDWLVRAQIVVVSTPVFFYGIPASFKALVDRSQVLWARRYFLGEQFSPKKGFLMGVGATRGEKLFDGVRLTTKYFFDAFGCTLDGELFFKGFDKKGSIASCERCLKEVDNAAQSFFGAFRLEMQESLSNLKVDENPDNVNQCGDNRGS